MSIPTSDETTAPPGADESGAAPGPEAATGEAARPKGAKTPKADKPKAEAGAEAEVVVTHGEPHPGNLIDTADGLSTVTIGGTPLTVAQLLAITPATAGSA